MAHFATRLLLLFVHVICCVLPATHADDYRNELKILRKEIKALERAEQIYEKKLSKLEAMLGGQKVDIGTGLKRATQAATVSFSARLTHDLGNLHDNQIFLFDHVNTNVGNNYDPTTGAFHCPEAGLFVFQLSIVAVPGGYLTSQITKNHRGMAWAFSHDPQVSSSGGTMVVVHLDPGDIVHARVNGNDHDHRQSTIAAKFSSFSGFLIG